MVFLDLTSTYFHKNLFSKWMSKMYYLDILNESFIGFVLMSHRHNHPIMITFVNLLVRMELQIQSTGKKSLVKQRAIDQSEEEIGIQKDIRIVKRTRNRIYMCYMMHKNRRWELWKLRKHNL